MSENMKEMIEFPVIYTFKAMGHNSDTFIKGIKDVFCGKEVESIEEKPSSKGNYVSVSVTVEVVDFNELQTFYTSITKVEGLKFHL
jgi:putative lipoic acid-binding regulatory protein